MNHEALKALFEAIEAAPTRKAAIQALAEANLFGLSAEARRGIERAVATAIDAKFPQQTTNPKRRSRSRRKTTAHNHQTGECQ
jgi:hypothetical protein